MLTIQNNNATVLPGLTYGQRPVSTSDGSSTAHSLTAYQQAQAAYATYRPYLASAAIVFMTVVIAASCGPASEAAILESRAAGLTLVLDSLSWLFTIPDYILLLPQNIIDTYHQIVDLASNRGSVLNMLQLTLKAIPMLLIGNWFRQNHHKLGKEVPYVAMFDSLFAQSVNLVRTDMMVLPEWWLRTYGAKSIAYVSVHHGLHSLFDTLWRFQIHHGKKLTNPDSLRVRRLINSLGTGLMRMLPPFR